MSEPAGWYSNPDGTESERYWDGSRWTHDVRPVVTGPALSVAPPTVSTDQVGGGYDAEADSGHLLHPDGRDDAARFQPDGRDGTVPASGHILPPDGRHPAGEPDPSEGRVGPRFSSPSGALTDLLRTLFDPSLERTIGVDQARAAYRVGLAAVGLVVVLMLVVTLRSGGLFAIVSLVLWPTLGLLSLVHLRAVLQAATATAPAVDRQDDEASPTTA